MFGKIIQKINGLTVKFLLALIYCYRFLISSFTKRNCRFYPTCSAYAEEALRSHGLLRGLYFTLHRLVRCHPFHRGAFYDPVPKARVKSHGN